MLSDRAAPVPAAAVRLPVPPMAGLPLNGPALVTVGAAAILLQAWLTTPLTTRPSAEDVPSADAHASNWMRRAQMDEAPRRSTLEIASQLPDTPMQYN